MLREEGGNSDSRIPARESVFLRPEFIDFLDNLFISRSDSDRVDTSIT